jgi:hypothetical protein
LTTYRETPSCAPAISIRAWSGSNIDSSLVGLKNGVP